MTRQRSKLKSEKGVAIIYTLVTLGAILVCVGLAIDTGRAYMVKAQLMKAVDGAALGAARMLNSGNPRAEAARLFKANFPDNFMGTTSVTDPTTDPSFFQLTTNNDGVHIVRIQATAILPTTLMHFGNFNTVTVASSGEATRRLVDLSLVVDVSGSIGWRWPYVRDAVREFINAFDENGDRLSLTTYSYGAKVIYPMPSNRGFDKTAIKAAVPQSLPGGVTSMAEGLYRGWDELRSVPAATQSALRVIVLFTDGSGNTVPGLHDGSGIAKGLFTSDFPKRSPDPDNITTSSPAIMGLYDTESGTAGPSYSITVSPWTRTTTLPAVKYLPLASLHDHHRSGGIPNSFPLQTSLLTVGTNSQQSVRGLRNWDSVVKKYPADVFNIRNAATNLTEIIGNAARSDTQGDYGIRIYAIGMGELVRYMLGTVPESSESVLMRVANDVRSPDYNPDQLEGKYYYAQTEADIGPAFQQLQSQIIRLSK